MDLYVSDWGGVCVLLDLFVSMSKLTLRCTHIVSIEIKMSWLSEDAN